MLLQVTTRQLKKNLVINFSATNQISRGGRRLFKRNTVTKWLRGVLGHQVLFPRSDSPKNHLQTINLFHHEAKRIVQSAPLVTVIQLRTTTTGLKLALCCQL